MNVMTIVMSVGWNCRMKWNVLRVMERVNRHISSVKLGSVIGATGQALFEMPDTQEDGRT